ncbi:MAG: hypothetical protein ABJM22_14965, partial [Balneola sp.]
WKKPHADNQPKSGKPQTTTKAFFNRIETQKRQRKNHHETNTPGQTHNIILSKQGFSSFVGI